MKVCRLSFHLILYIVSRCAYIKFLIYWRHESFSEKTLVFIRHLFTWDTGGILCSALPRGIRGRVKGCPVDNRNMRWENSISAADVRKAGMNVKNLNAFNTWALYHVPVQPLRNMSN
jgi:hypothetical protein